jgi:hypothetical protein
MSKGLNLAVWQHAQERKEQAAGQSLWGWLSVNIALLLWCNFYRVCCPAQKLAFWAPVVGWVLNSCVVLTVIYFRYLV